MALVSQTKNEFVVTEMRVVLHEMPQDWQSPDGDHWLWKILGNVSDSRSISTTENYSFHAGLLACGVQNANHFILEQRTVNSIASD
jgi:hypothetical protein